MRQRRRVDGIELAQHVIPHLQACGLGGGIDVRQSGAAGEVAVLRTAAELLLSPAPLGFMDLHERRIRLRGRIARGRTRLRRQRQGEKKRQREGECVLHAGFPWGVANLG